MAKRYGYLVARIIESFNMERAFDEVVSQLKESRRNFYRNKRDKIIALLTKEIGDGTFRVKGYQEMLVTDGPKIRLVQSPCVRDRIGCNAIMRIIEDVIYPSVIKTSAASIPGRGMHHLFEKMRHDIDSSPEKTKYFYKCDIKKFFESIDQEVMWQCVKHYVKDPVILPILHSFVTLMPNGLSIGLRSSQCYGNIILSAIDHYFKDVLGIKYYYRYCDDIVILASSKRKLWMLRDIMHEQVVSLGLHIKPNETVKPISAGLDFLGFIYDGKKARLRKRTKHKAARKLAKVKSRKRRQEIIGSLKGMAKWGDCKHLHKTLTGKDMNSFAELKKQKSEEGVVFTGKDGKRILNGNPENLRALVNTHIVVLDFEADVPTKNGLRYVVQFKKDDGTICKYLTNDSEQKFWLEELRKSGKIPFECTITPQFFGQGKVRYSFS